MKIGIDSKWLFSGNPSGRVVVNNLLKELINLNKDHELYIFLKNKERHLKFPYSNAKVKLVYIWGNNNLVSNLFIMPFYLRKYKIDLGLFFYFAPLFSYSKKIVFVFDAIFKSNPEYFSLLELIYFAPIRYLAKHSDLILTISKSEKRRLLKYNFGKNKNIDVIYMGIDKCFQSKANFTSSEILRVTHKYNLPDKYIFYVGRINLRKNIPNLLKAISLLSDKSIKLVIAGKIDWKNIDLKKLISEYEIGEKVIEIGFVEDIDLPIIYSLAKIFCYVSFDEGFGLPPIESLASQVPVVVAKAGSLPEICGEAGLYCNPFDPKDISEKIDYLLSNNNLYEEKKKLGVEIVSNFNWELSANAVLNTFDKVMLRE